MTKDLRKWRKKIDKVDKRLEKLLGKREKLIKEIGKVKKRAGIKIEHLSREKEVLKKIESPTIRKVFKEIMKISKELQGKL